MSGKAVAFSALEATAPEAVLPAELLVNHTSTVVMAPLIALAIICIIVGLIVYNTTASSVPGLIILAIGGYCGVRAFMYIQRN
jgi:predicted membrane protein